ncbi:aminoglycoside phosphotransferase [Acidihalobacter aeolianus]|uniref:Aminoglycoside phosphotransferase n=1 Tax=Acidihalobacter aeolianus TaxID=2792603 RepID=A0A1D8K628_9GAMM|nr:phosphotransferase [Acidihalobacter aeolianus]AOV16416.1 aminoglycoside phosphotransferase [Acidihalobacter aeolianus]
MAEVAQDPRRAALADWLAEVAPGSRDLRPASGDASFRRYFRLDTDGGPRIAMDAPPAQEQLAPFLEVTARLAAAGVHVPQVHAADADLGFVLLDDLGTRHYLDALDADNVDALYGDALDALVRIAAADSAGLPDYDHALLAREMALFPDWLLDRHLGLTLDGAQRTTLDAVCEALIASALAQPQIFVHRDYHARNLMLTEEHNPGVLDYQDAVRGPLAYDLVSLVRDAYLSWPEARVRGWALAYRDRAVAAGLCAPTADDDFLRAFDLMGVQRQLKVLGIFARLWHRDGKPGYLSDLPRVLAYVEAVAPRHPETAPLAALIGQLDLRRRLQEAARPCAR